MSDPFLSLIANLNSESPGISSPEDYSAELSLWTNAEFTFDMPPGLGIFEHDSGFEALSAMNQAHALPASTPAASALNTKAAPAKAVGHNPQSAIDQQHLMEYLNLPQEESRPLSLLERTRQRNPVNGDTPQSLPELQEQAAAINAFHSLLAAYSASAQMHQQQQQLQQPQPVQQQQQQPQRSSGLPLLLPNSAPATAPTTPAAAKLLRQPMPQYKAASKKQPKAQAPATIAPATLLATLAPKSPTTANAHAIAVAATASVSKAVSTMGVSALSPESKDSDEELEAMAANSGSKEDLDTPQKEEDKRRRNTAASARFRHKKKLREQALEQTAQEQTFRAEALEARVKELEMEVKWLRGLIVEKDSRLHEVSANLEDQANKRIKLDVY
ncbi:hypothetical protein BGZ99_006739 [Dissophora globulifera]|uniref:BZIP domain-containing protein n=1 Tax=Dissophora globulifera TaxID=979702 RepID=A0A9P6UQR4_9FUNG|nr:hypothetical protein BGZ99_006739 [Dissophora globulifera]